MNNQSRINLFDAISLRRKGNERKSYMEIFFIPICAAVLLTVILVSLSVHVINYGGITKSTKTRQKIQGDVSECKIICADEYSFDISKLEDAMKYFASKTGIMPNIYICSEYNGDAESLFLQYKTDENCFFTVYGVSYGSVNAIAGEQARQVLDDEAYDIFCEYVDYYKSIIEDSCEILEYAYKSTADRIMVKTNIFNCVSEKYHIGIILTIIFDCFFVLKMINEVKENNKMTSQEDKNGKLQ